MSQYPHFSSTPQPPAAALQRLRRLSRLLDRAIVIPGTRIGIGLDPILGLLPGAGDFLGVALSGYIVLEAARLGASKETLTKMVFNIIVDSFVGTVPFLGDLFDFAWKANTKNIDLLEAHLKVPRQTQRANRWFVFLLLVGLLIIAVGLLTFTVGVIQLLVKAITG